MWPSPSMFHSGTLTAADILVCFSQWEIRAVLLSIQAERRHPDLFKMRTQNELIKGNVDNESHCDFLLSWLELEVVVSRVHICILVREIEERPQGDT